MTEQEKWETICDDPELIELLKTEGETPESSSGMTTEEIEELKVRQDERNAELEALGPRRYIWDKIAGGLILFCVGYWVFKALKKAYQGFKEIVSVIKERFKQRKES